MTKQNTQPKGDSQRKDRGNEKSFATMTPKYWQKRSKASATEEVAPMEMECPQCGLELDLYQRQRDELQLKLISARLERGQLRKERDELLSAAKEAVAIMQRNGVGYGETQLRAAIAKAEGKS